MSMKLVVLLGNLMVGSMVDHSVTHVMRRSRDTHVMYRVGCGMSGVVLQREGCRVWEWDVRMGCGSGRVKYWHWGQGSCQNQGFV